MKIVTGNILDVTSGTVLHQVNCMGATGGLAGALRRQWPAAFNEYATHCENEGRDMLGRFIHSEALPGLYVGHVFGQLYPGPNTDMDAVRRSLAEAADNTNGQVYAPFKMGCGMGGGNWSDYLAELERVFPCIIIIQRPEDAL